MLAIIKNIILRELRAPGYILFSMLFPVVLAVVIGNVTKSASDYKVELESKNVYYSVEDSEKYTVLFDSISEFYEGELHFKPLLDKNATKNTITSNGDILIEAKGDELNIYVQSGDTDYYTYLKSLIVGYNSRYSVIDLIASTNEAKLQEVLANGEIKEIKNEVLTKEASPIGINYYGIASLTMMILYMNSFPLNGIFSDKKRGLLDRMKLSGISASKYMFSSIVGYSILASIMVGVSIFILKTIFKVNFGDNVLLVYAGMVSFAIVSIILGCAIGYVVSDKNKDMITGIVEGGIIPIISFMGGAYMLIPYGSFGIFNPILDYSPLRALNKGVFDLIYLNDAKLLLGAGLSYIIIAVICSVILINIVKIKERARI